MLLHCTPEPGSKPPSATLPSETGAPVNGPEPGRHHGCLHNSQNGANPSNDDDDAEDRQQSQQQNLDHVVVMFIVSARLPAAAAVAAPAPKPLQQ